MLVLGRNEGEALVLDNGVKVTVVKARNGRARIGIDAPEDVRILREELIAGVTEGSTEDAAEADAKEGTL